MECTRIVDAFANFAYDALHYKFTFDVFVEADLNQVRNFRAGIKLRKPLLQINQVRKFFSYCILTKICALRVHWSDIKYFDYEQFEAKHAGADLSDFASAEEMKALKRFNNPSFQKEIGKANLQKMLTHFPSWILKYALGQKFDNKLEAAFIARRIMMDIYSVSRIMKMKPDPQDDLMNVVYYAGYHHTQFAAQLCETMFGFKRDESWETKANPCFLEGTAVRKMPLGVVFHPPMVSNGARHTPHGTDARAAFIGLCKKHFGSKNLVGVKHSGMWFNEKTGQTIYFLGESHMKDRGIVEGQDWQVLYGRRRDRPPPVTRRTGDVRQANIDERNERVKDKQAASDAAWEKYHKLKNSYDQLCDTLDAKVRSLDPETYTQYTSSIPYLKQKLEISKLQYKVALAYPFKDETSIERSLQNQGLFAAKLKKAFEDAPPPYKMLRSSIEKEPNTEAEKDVGGFEPEPNTEAEKDVGGFEPWRAWI